ncbi:MAG: DUF211 domain-containing protein [Candidatus Thermoplasmatota archaeon]|jgi:hypothetical protein|nr:DUF211 domain-containing protein [Candidatus Thermoplasmatota archaeon]MCL5785209.1 DUF211 domain-containing protein [Candidatus Thermoplasmatota archaeon]
MNVRRVVLDVDKSVNRPTLVELANAISAVPGVEGVNILVTEMDVGTMGMNITVEGQNIDYDELLQVVENTGAAVHSIDEIAVGKRLIENKRP